ncbi:cytochrome c3 family protein [Polyangium aurulentum]|uniref:cytochrome c3 family protein n=1 Tax=Polyangium aurulentum TaxID=2567896 RepID=UPI0010AEE0C3|nr:cytochrome c3 family protein [Polyangium aurulentum]
MARYIFPRWSNRVLPMVVGLVLLPLGTAAAGGLWYYGTNKHVEVGYTPTQPVDYSHKLHAGDLGIDCRYCHTAVDKSANATVPPTETCMNCHSKVKTDSPKLLPVRESYASGNPIPWVRVHNLPDYAYFNHQVHVTAAVGCQSCHGRVDQMIKVSQVEPLSMGWCLDCHRNPEPSLRAPSDVTKMVDDTASLAKAAGAGGARKVSPPVNCSGCHR